MKLKTLNELSQNKKIILYGLAMLIFLIVVIKSFMGTYNNEKSKWLKREDIAKNKEIVVTDKSVLDLDQTVAIKNKINEIEKEFDIKLNSLQTKNDTLSEDINKNQQIIIEQQKELIALRELSKKEIDKNDKEKEEQLKNLKKQLDDTKKRLEKMDRKTELNEKLVPLEIDLPPLQGPLADVIKREENKTILSEISNDSNNVIVETKKENSFFEFGTLKTEKVNDINSDSKKEKNTTTVGKEEDNTPSMDLMMGLVDATLVMGVDAPTNIGTKNSDAKDPLPVLLSVSGEALIANNYRQDYKDCLILATATGNATTERAYLRLSKLSCVSQNGEKRIESDIEGWVVGEDNKTGLSGHLVTKSGTLILKGLMAGIAQSLAETASNADNYFTTAPNGQQVVSSTAAEGFGNGAGSAFKTIADFYIEMAKDLYPVIEVRGGRQVQILIKGSKQVKEVPYNKLFVNSDFELPVNNNISIAY